MKSRDRSFNSSRRRFLRSAAAVAVGGPALLAACNDDSANADDPAEPNEAEARGERDRVAFYGEHQAGVLLRAPESGIVVAFDSQAADRAELREAVRVVSTEAE